MDQKEVFLKENQDYITLQSLLKISGVISTGGMVKEYLQDNRVLVNGEVENRRGRKLYDGDVIQFSKKEIVIKRYDCQ